MGKSRSKERNTVPSKVKNKSIFSGVDKLICGKMYWNLEIRVIWKYSDLKKWPFRFAWGKIGSNLVGVRQKFK
jgi:hypothetical protein